MEDTLYVLCDSIYEFLVVKSFERVWRFTYSKRPLQVMQVYPPVTIAQDSAARAQKSRLSVS